MNWLEIVSKGTFVASIFLVIYLVYFEWKSAKIRAEQDEIKLGEKENEDQVAALSDSDVVDLVNKQFGGSSSPSGQGKSSPVPGSSDASGNVKGAGNKKS